jgi:hypothetical protein
MRKTFRVVLGTALLAAAAAAGQSPVLLGEAGSWQKVFAAGLEVYQTSGADGAFSIDCDVASTLDGSATGISIQMPDGLLPPDSEVTLAVDGAGPMVFPTDRSGGVGLRGCPECRSRLAQLWPLLRSGSRLEVVASDGRRATFRLDGTAALMPPGFCAATN